MRNIFEVSFTEEGTGSGKDIFEVGFKFAASEARKKFGSTASADGGANGEQLGSNQLIDRWQFMRDKNYSNK